MIVVGMGGEICVAPWHLYGAPRRRLLKWLLRWVYLAPPQALTLFLGA